jgi:O-antigen ligase
MRPWQLVTFIVAPLALMYLVNLKDKQYIISNIRVVSIASFVSLLIILANDTFTSYDDGDRLGQVMNANEVGIGGLLCFLFLFLLYTHKDIKLYSFLALSIVPSYVVILSGSRSAFLPFFFVICSLYVTNRSKNFLKTLSSLLFGVLVMIFVFIPTLEQNTIIINRLKESKSEGVNGVNTGTYLDNLGSRAQYYVYGYEMFKENKLFGVGLFNYRKFNPANTQPNHVEVMIQLSELGIFGFLFFILFNYWILKHLVNCWRKHVKSRRQTEAFVVCYLSVFSLYFVAYTYMNILIALMLGITISYIIEIENRIKLDKMYENEELMARLTKN